MEFFLRKLEEFQDWIYGTYMGYAVRCYKIFMIMQRDIGESTA